MARILSVMCRVRITFSNIFSSGITGLIGVKFHVEYPWDKERKFINGIEVT